MLPADLSDLVGCSFTGRNISTVLYYIEVGVELGHSQCTLARQWSWLTLAGRQFRDQVRVISHALQQRHCAYITTVLLELVICSLYVHCFFLLCTPELQTNYTYLRGG